MKTRTLYELYTNTDRTEGRGMRQPICYAVSEEAAQEIIHSPDFYKRHGIMGCDNCDYRLVVELPTYEGIEDYRNRIGEFERDKVRAAALAKLTKQEREVLGLED